MVDYLFGFAASTEAVSDHHFDQLFASYLEDERVRDFMKNANPAALRETADRFAEAEVFRRIAKGDGAGGKRFAIALFERAGDEIDVAQVRIDDAHEPFDAPAR